MSLVAVGVTVGTADVAGLVAITTTNIGSSVLQIGTTTTSVLNTVSADVAALGALISTALTAVNQGTTDVATALTAAGAVATDGTTCVTDYTTVANQATYGLVHLLNNQTFTAGTLQLSGTPGASATLTVAQQQSLIAACNALGTALLANQAAANTANTDVTTVSTDLATIYTDVAALGTSTINTAITAANTSIQGAVTTAATLLPGANVYLQTDTTVATNVATLNGALVAALTYIRANGILPT
jgi:hypothetical protein